MEDALEGDGCFPAQTGYHVNVAMDAGAILTVSRATEMSVSEIWRNYRRALGKDVPRKEKGIHQCLPPDPLW